MKSIVRFSVVSALVLSIVSVSVPAAAKMPTPPAPAPAPAGSGSGSAPAPTATTPPPVPTPPAPTGRAAQLQKEIDDLRGEVGKLRKQCSETCKKGADDKPAAPPPPPPSQVCYGGPQPGICEEQKRSDGGTKAVCLIPGSAGVKTGRDTKRNADVIACQAPATVVPRVAAVENTVDGVVNAMLGNVARDRKTLEEKLVAFDKKAKELGIDQPSEREQLVGLIGALRLLEKDVSSLGGVIFGDGQPFTMIIVDGRPMPLKAAIEAVLGKYDAIGARISALEARVERIERDLESRNRLTLGATAFAALRARGENLLGVLGTFGGVTTWGGYAQLAAGGGLGAGKLNGAVIVGQAELGYLAGDPRGAQFGIGGFGRMAKGVSTFSNGGVDAGLGLRGLIPVGDGGTRLQLGVQGYQSFADCYGSGAPGCSGLGLGLTLGVDSGHAPTGKTGGSNATAR